MWSFNLGEDNPLLFIAKDKMIAFFDVNPTYANYLRQFDSKIPNISYSSNNKFVCGIVLQISQFNYFAPISSNRAKQQTNILIEDDKGNILSSIKFSFMFPAPLSEVSRKDFELIRQLDPAYADLLSKEYKFCKLNENAIYNKAKKIYAIGCNPKHILFPHCCDFRLLEEKCKEYK